MLSLESLKITCDFPSELQEIAQSINAKKAAKLKMSFETVYDFVAIMYYFKFEKKYENSYIAKLLGEKKVENIHQYYYNLRWHYSTIYEENMKLSKDHKERLETLFCKAKAKIKEIDFTKCEGFLLDPNKLIRKKYPSTYTKYGIDSFEDYRKILYYLLNIENISPIDLSIMLDIAYGTIHARLREVGLNLGKKEGVARKKERKSQNYEKTRRNYYTAQARNNAERFSSGSINEDYFRAIFSGKIYDYFDSSKYDIVVGINNTGILGQKEIDIPVMIYNIRTNALYKFVLEYNGPHHIDDSEKIALASERGWIYKAIFEKQGSRISNDKSLIEEMVNQVCQELRDYVKANECINSVVSVNS